MSRTRRGTPPAYGIHKASGNARTRIGGKVVWLGRYNTAESRNRYAAVIEEWRRNLVMTNETDIQQRIRGELLIDEAIADYLDWCELRYVKRGRQTSEVDIQRLAMTYLSESYGDLKVSEMSPLKLSKLVDRMIAADLMRSTANALQSRIVHLFRWLSAREKCPISVHQALSAVEHLRSGRPTDSGLIAREPAEVEPVPLKDIATTLRHLTPVMQDMVRLQRLTGARPGEICNLRPEQVKRNADDWLWRPPHKMEHNPRIKRRIQIGPRARLIMGKYLNDRLPGDRCFNMEESSYRRAIRRVCEEHGIHPWKPNQLRHTRATELADKFDSEAAQVTLGHSSLKTTEIYAQKSLRKAKEIAEQVG